MIRTVSEASTFVRVVDELRRLQRVTPRPPNKIQAEAIRKAEQAVDELLALHREADPGETLLASDPTNPGASALP